MCLHIDSNKHTIILTLSSYDYFLSEYVNDRFRNDDGVKYTFIFYAVYTMDKLFGECKLVVLQFTPLRGSSTK